MSRIGCDSRLAFRGRGPGPEKRVVFSGCHVHGNCIGPERQFWAAAFWGPLLHKRLLEVHNSIWTMERQHQPVPFYLSDVFGVVLALSPLR